MSSQCVVAEFDSLRKARNTLEVLAKSDYRGENVSYLANSEDPELKVLQNILDESKSEAGSSVRAGAGGLIGAALATPLAAGTLIGPFILVGPLVAFGIASSLGGLLGVAKDSEVANKDSKSRVKDCIERGGVIILGM